MKLLIDLDILVYRAGFAAQKTMYRFVYHGSGAVRIFPDQTYKAVLETLKSEDISPNDGKLQKLVKPDPLEFALYSAKNMLQTIIKRMEKEYGQVTTELYLTSSDKSNYRFNVARTQVYKGNRKQPKPVHYDDIREYYISKHGARVIRGKEADDQMGIDQCTSREDSIICTIDKDLDMIPGLHYNFVTDSIYETTDPGDLKLVSGKRKLIGGGLKFFYAQMLMGDSADNIPGIPGYGPVKVYDILEDCDTEEEMLQEVHKVYKKKLPADKYLSRLLEVADLLWIQRQENERKSVHIEEMLDETTKR